MSYQKFYSNQIHSSSLLCQLSQLWKSQVLCDAIIRTGTIITKAHRLVLIAACPMLQSMENAAAGSHLEVKLSADIKQDSVNTFLQYLYEGFMMLTEDNIKDVEKIARLLQVDGVTKCCADFYKCLQASGVYIQPAGQYKYSFQDLVEFRHVRSSNVVKTAQVLKRSSDFTRPGSPGLKRPKMHQRPNGSSDDYRPVSDSVDRVPSIGLHGHSPARHHSGPIEIVEDGLEFVQSDPIDINKPHGPLHDIPKTVAISIASQISDNTDVRVVNMSERSAQNSSNASYHKQTPSFPSMSFSSSSVSSSSRVKHSDSVGPSPRTEMQMQRREEYANLGINASDTDSVLAGKPACKTNETVSSFPLSMPPISGSKPFAAGSASQSSPPGSSQANLASPIGSSVPSPHPKEQKSLPATNNRKISADTPSSAEPEKVDGDKPDESNNISSTADLAPDLSIVKIEASRAEDTGGLEMYVDTPGTSMMDQSNQEITPGPSDPNRDEEFEEWARQHLEEANSSLDEDVKDNYSGPLSAAHFCNRSESLGPNMDFLNPSHSVSQNLYGLNHSGLKHWIQQRMMHNIFQTPAISQNYLKAEYNVPLQEYVMQGEGGAVKHELVRTFARKRCVLCSSKKLKTRSGWAIFASHQCNVCFVALCGGKNCFEEYHDNLKNDKD